MNRDEGLLITVLALALIAIAAYGSDLAYRYAQRAFAAPAQYDPVGNIQMVRPTTNTAGTCLVAGGAPLVDRDSGLFVACLMAGQP